MSVLGIGSSKSKSTTNATLTKNETTNQNSQQTGSTATATDSTTTNKGSSTGSTSSTQTQGTQNAQTQKGTQTTNAFSSDVLSGLEAAVGGLFNSTGKSSDAVDALTQKLANFDSNSFVSSSVAAAKGTIDSGLDSSIGSLRDRIGATGGTNSMAALLENRLTGDAAAQLEGVRANAEAQAQGIQRENATATVSANQGETSVLNALLNALKGGSTTTTGVQDTTGSSTGTASATGTTSETSDSTQATKGLTTVLSQLTELLSGTTSAVGTQNSTTKGKESGFGISL